MESVCKWLSRGTRCSAPTPPPLLETLPAQTPYTVPLVSAGIPRLSWLLKVLAANRQLRYLDLRHKVAKTKQGARRDLAVTWYGWDSMVVCIKHLLGPWVPQECLNLDSIENGVLRRFFWGYESHKHRHNKRTEHLLILDCINIINCRVWE